MKTITTNMTAWRIAPLSEPIGFTGDNMVTRLEVVTNLEAGWQLKLDIQKYGNANVIDLTRDGTLFYVDLTADVLSFTGTASAQIRGLNGEKVAHSNQFDFTVRQSINAIDTFPPLEPTEMAQMEARVTAVKDAAEGAKVGAEQSATQAKASETNAKQSETAAKLSEDNAKSSETAASTAAQDALTSEAAAKLSEANAATSQVAAKTSETAAQESETVAAAQATAATQKAVDAAASATAAKASEDAAKQSETNSKASEDNAKLSEANAKTSETNSEASENAAKLSETKAKTSETNALSSETKSKASETNAKTSETNAKTSETNALASAGTAEAAKAEASTQAGNATAEANRAKAEADRAESSLELKANKTDVDTALELKADKTDLSSTRLYVSEIGKELSDYTKLMSQVNVNQEAKQTVTGYDKIRSLPKNAANGSASFELKGLTAQNLVPNGDFSNGTNGWAISAGSMSATSNVCTFTATGNFCAVYQTKNAQISSFLSHKIYTAADVKASAIGIARLYLVTTSIYGKYNTLVGAFERISDVFTVPSNSTQLILGVQDVRTSNFDAIQFKNHIAIDLTAIFGSGNEPDLATCDKMFANWFDGTKSVKSRGRVRSVGKNLFDKSKRKILRTVNPNTGIEGGATSSDLSEFIPIQSNVSYIMSGKTEYSNIAFYNNYREYISGSYAPTGVITSPVNARFVRITVSQAEVDTFQLELGSTATPYEPYKEIAKYFNVTEPLRRVPNGVCDEIRQRSDGGYELVQRCAEYVLQAGDVAELTTGTEYQYATIPKSVFVGCAAWGETVEGKVSVAGYPIISGDDVSDVLWLHLPLGTYADLATAQAALAGTKIIYQLATPIITPIETSGTLLSYPSGTTYWEPITADAGVYNNGISVLATDFPISALETLAKADFNTGLETPLDVSTAVIASDGLSFTHPSLVNGDIVLFSYRFKDDNPEGNKTMDYYDSRYVVEDSVTGKFYQWSISVADGVPSFALTEV